jgi:transcriptional regulator with XRE-family HTH domain
MSTAATGWRLDGLAAARRAALLSQAALAARAGVAPRTVRELEAGRRAAYRATVARLAAALGVTPAALLSPRRARA